MSDGRVASLLRGGGKMSDNTITPRIYDRGAPKGAYHCYRTTTDTKFILVASYRTRTAEMALAKLKRDGKWNRRDRWLVTTDLLTEAPLEEAWSMQLFD